MFDILDQAGEDRQQQEVRNPRGAAMRFGNLKYYSDRDVTQAAASRPVLVDLEGLG